MFFDEVVGQRANNINSQGVFLGILKGRRYKLESNSFSPQVLGDFCMPDRHPAMTIRFEFQIADLTILFNLKPALGHLRSFAHAILAFQMIQSAG